MNLVSTSKNYTTNKFLSEIAQRGVVITTGSTLMRIGAAGGTAN
jgi:hypothetical protein